MHFFHSKNPFLEIFHIYLSAMVFKIEHNHYLIGTLRRKWRKDGRYTVRVTRAGTVCVIRMPLHEDMKTEAQLKCRKRFVKAQEMMLEALKDKKLRRFFQKRRRRKGYKTLRGCMRAYYIDQLIYQEQKEERDALGEKMRERLASVECNVDVAPAEEEITASANGANTDKHVVESVEAVEVNIVDNQGAEERDVGDG